MSKDHVVTAFEEDESDDDDDERIRFRRLKVAGADY